MPSFEPASQTESQSTSNSDSKSFNHSKQLATESEPSNELCRRSKRIATKPKVQYASQCESTCSTVSNNSAEPLKPAKTPSKSNNKDTRVIYPLRKSFSWNKCHDLSQKYKLAIYQNMKEGPEAQAKAVEAVFFHEQDYPEASVEERKAFHHLCGMWCKFKVWEAQGKPLEGFKRIKKDLQGNEVVWEGGLIAKFRIEHPDAYNELHEIFKKLGCLELMKRCGKKSTQNINESTHAKLWKYCKKSKKHTRRRYIFACKHVITQNFGHYAGSLHNVKNNEGGDRKSPKI